MFNICQDDKLQPGELVFMQAGPNQKGFPYSVAVHRSATSAQVGFVADEDCGRVWPHLSNASIVLPPGRRFNAGRGKVVKCVISWTG